MIIVLRRPRTSGTNRAECIRNKHCKNVKNKLLWQQTNSSAFRMFYLGVMRGSHFQIHTLRKKAIPFSYIRSLFDASLPGEYLSSASLRTLTGFQIIPLRDSEWLPNIGEAIVRSYVLVDAKTD